MKRLLAGALVALGLCAPAHAQLFGSGSGNVNSGGSFLPNFGTGQTISATTTSSSITLTGVAVSSVDLLVTNAGTDAVYCRWGVGAQTALTSDIYLLSGTTQVFTKAANANTVACRAATTTATVVVITGAGH